MTHDLTDLGTPELSSEEMLQLGETVATGHDNVVVFLDPTLPAWEDDDDA